MVLNGILYDLLVLYGLGQIGLVLVLILWPRGDTHD